MARVKVADTGDLDPGEGMPVEAEAHSIALFNVGGSFHAIENTCCHRGGPLGDGELEGTVVSCPWHGWQFDVTTGKCTGPDASQSVPTLPVTVEGDEVFVEVG